MPAMRVSVNVNNILWPRRARRALLGSAKYRLALRREARHSLLLLRAFSASAVHECRGAGRGAGS